MSVSAFLSHSHHDLRVGNAIKKQLADYGIEVFLAHKDLKPSTEWQKVIRQHLRDCEVFLPLLTTHFHESYWTDQETGIAVAHRKFILPLKVDVNPYGFISEIQALRIGKSIGDSCWKIARALAAEPDFSREVRSAVIEMFAASGSFDETPLIATRLAELRPFSNSEARAIVAGSANNLFGVARLLGDVSPENSLTVSLTSTNTVVVSWPYPSTGWNLQQNNDLTTANWVTPPETVNNDGTNNFIIVIPSAGSRFYRLEQ